MPTLYLRMIQASILTLRVHVPILPQKAQSASGAPAKGLALLNGPAQAVTENHGITQEKRQLCRLWRQPFEGLGFRGMGSLSSA